MRTPISRRARARPVVHTSPFTPSASTKDPIVVAANAQGHTMLRLTRRPHPFLAFLASGARAASMAAPFFTTEGRLMRGAVPTSLSNLCRAQGPSLIQPAAGGGLEAALVSEAAARPYVDGATETLIGTAEEGAPAARGGRVSLPTSAPAGAARAGGAWPRRCDVAAAARPRRLVGVRPAGGGGRGLAARHRRRPCQVARQNFCGVSGGRTVPEARRQGRVRRAPNWRVLRPRVDLSVIMLVVDGDRCLLGRKAEWPAGGTDAGGLVEFGESLEECLVREVYEEAGVRVKRDGLRFVASQPWLFPRSLMVGFMRRPSRAPRRRRPTRRTTSSRTWGGSRAIRCARSSRAATRRTPSSTCRRRSLARVIIEEWIASGK